MKNICLVAGATGLIGRHLVDQLCNSSEVSEVHALVRSKTSFKQEKVRQHVIDFDDLPHLTIDGSPTAVFSCLGTTRKKSKSDDAYRKVDYDYVVNLAEYASKAGARQFHLVSSMGANTSSSVFYNRLKGEVEETVTKKDIHSIYVYRPSLLLGKRNEKRLGEKIGGMLLIFFSFLLLGQLKKYRAIPAQMVAAAMRKMMERNSGGVHYFNSQKIKDIANDLSSDSE